MLCLFLIMLSIYFDLIDAHKQFIFRFKQPKLNAECSSVQITCSMFFLQFKIISNLMYSNIKRYHVHRNIVNEKLPLWNYSFDIKKTLTISWSEGKILLWRLFSHLMKCTKFQIFIWGQRGKWSKQLRARRCSKMSFRAECELQEMLNGL